MAIRKTMKNIFSLLTLPVTAMLLFSAASCGGDKSKTDANGNNWSKDNILVYHWRAEPDNLHPTNGKSNPRRVIMDFTQRFLLSTDMANKTLRPDLVKALPTVSEDGLSYTYELRDDAKWDDGSSLSMDDILFTFKAYVCPLTNNAQAKGYFEFLKSITVDPANPLKFTTVMKEKYIQNTAFSTDMVVMQRKMFDKGNVLAAYSIEQLMNPDFAKTKHADLETWANEFNDPKYGRDMALLSGLGAYKVTAWEEKQRIELTRKTDHWTSKIANPTVYDRSYPDKIILKIITDDNAISLELKKQVIDASTWISTTKLVELQEDADFNKNYKSDFVNNYDYQYIGMNLKPQSANRPALFTDKKVRRAMALLTPVDDIIKTHLLGKAARMVSYISPIKDSYNKDLQPLAYNTEEAKKLLDEAGWKDSDGDNIRDKMIDGKKTQMEFELLIMSGNPITEKVAKDIAAAYYRAGVKVNYRSLEFGAFYEKVQVHEFDMYMGAWAGSFFPDDPKQIWHYSNWANKGSNYVGFGTPESDRLIDSIRVTINDSARTGMEKRLQALIYDEQPYIFMYVPPRKIAVHKRFENADFYYDKPGIILNNLKLLEQNAGTSSKPAM